MNKLTNWKAAVVLSVTGFACYCTGLMNPFLGDDSQQVVNNPLVHSLVHIKLLFEGSTFYVGNGLSPLSGTYYRPLMSVIFSLLYTLFGARAFYFHLIQLILFIASAIVLYLFFCYSFKRHLALALALLFLIHPLNSEIVYSISNLQDVLFFLFGILAIWLLLRFKSSKSLVFVNVSLFLSLLSKETGIVFVLMCLIYLIWWDRRRFYMFSISMVIPVTIWLMLKINAVGIIAPSAIAPIDKLNLSSRLMTDPSILLFFLSKFIFPWKLSTGYYWVHSTFSIRYVLLPLIVELIVVVGIIYGSMLVQKKLPRAQLFTYKFFAIWTAIGLLTTLQIVPLDMTVSDSWFYFPMAGVLGMIGVVCTTAKLHMSKNLLVVAIILIGIFGIRTALRGYDYGSNFILYQQDIAATKEDYIAYENVGNTLFLNNDLILARTYEDRSISIFPSYVNYVNLGQILSKQKDYIGAIHAYDNSLNFSKRQTLFVYQNLSMLTLISGNASTDKDYLSHVVNQYPNNSSLWFYLALFDEKNNDNAEAKVAILKSAQYGQVPQALYNNIMLHQTIILRLPALNTSVTIN